MTLMEVVLAVFALSVFGSASLAAWESTNRQFARGQVQYALTTCAEMNAERLVANHPLIATLNVAGNPCTTEVTESRVSNVSVFEVVSSIQGKNYTLWIPAGSGHP